MNVSGNPADSIRRAESASKQHGIGKRPGLASRLRRRSAGEVMRRRIPELEPCPQELPARAASQELPGKSCPARAARQELPGKSWPARAARQELAGKSCPARAGRQELPGKSCPARAAGKSLPA